jgi:hypothetical protein
MQPQRRVYSRLQALSFAYRSGECGLETYMGVGVGVGLKFHNSAGAGLKFYQNAGFYDRKGWKARVHLSRVELNTFCACGVENSATRRPVYYGFGDWPIYIFQQSWFH